MDGVHQKTIDLSSCGGIAKFSIPALHNKNCKIVYNGGVYKDNEFKFKLGKSSKSLIVGEDKEALSTSIMVVPDKISGVNGNVAKFSAKVVYNFNGVNSIATDGNLYLLKDGKTLQIADLIRNKNPSFSFKLEKGHKYSLMYSGAENVGEMSLDLSASSKYLNVVVLEKNIPKNQTKKQINQTINQTINETTNETVVLINQNNNQVVDKNANMQTTGYVIAGLVIVVIILVGLVVYLRKR